ncbi:hypothetical protein F5986_15385 [Dickeya dianthicola]|nr:hypothetical protein [Yersinia enterocolitica]EKN6368029.1 hypothetical protein [Yersinia enterocolitica]MZH99137.1 hypothetical protein [Dickeya dianthicola]
MVSLGGLTGRDLRFSLIISQLMAKAIPVKGAVFRRVRLRILKQVFCCSAFCIPVNKTIPLSHSW